jgi:hypothetical protein
VNVLDEKELQQLIKKDSPEARETVAKVERLSGEIESLKQKVTEFQNKGNDDAQKEEFNSLKNDLTEKKLELKNSLRDAIPNLNFDTERNQAVFYSGTHGREAAEKFCKSQNEIGFNYKTIEMTPAGKWLEEINVNDNLSKSQCGQIWRDASLQYAQSAEGRVVAFGDVSLAEKSHLWKTEVSALHQNKEVTGIDFKKIPSEIEEKHRFDKNQSEIKPPSIEDRSQQISQQKTLENTYDVRRDVEQQKQVNRDKDYE